ncbi:MAG: response regulator [Proteobacteria bacterium]|nr:response regulator [Pseudomonadota bacterium]
MITDILKLPPEFKKISVVAERQIIDLESALRRTNNERKRLRKMLRSFIGDVESMEIDASTVREADWGKTHREAVDLGVEQLADWLEWLVSIKKHSELIPLIDFQVAKRQFEGILNTLTEGVRCLEEHGFFSEKADGASTSPLAQAKVLLVEDMVHNRILLKKILEKNKCRIVEAVNGEDAVERWQQEDHFDLIIMDMNMPVMDGFTATKTIRKIEAEKSLEKTPIIALTALAMRGDRELCLEAGCDGYLPKPVEAPSLVGISEQLIAGKDAKPENNAHKQTSLEIQRVLLKTKHQIYSFSLTRILENLGIDVERHHDVSGVLARASEDKYDLLVLDAEEDLELAYYLKKKYPQKCTALITTRRQKDSLLCQRENNVQYPFRFEQVGSVLRHYSDKLNQARKKAETMADADSLGKLKGQVSIKEAVGKSYQQLAVWQKAFRKIGGDLVLSHQFNLHGKFGFILGDVAGHDIQSGYAASWFAGLVKGVWGQNSNPFSLLNYLNSFYAHDTEEEDKRFVCALALLWDPLRSKLYYANAGIPGGILVKKNTGKAEQIKWTGIPIGMFPDMDMFDHDEIDFFPGDRLYVATDGVLEAVPGEVISGISETQSDQLPQHALESIVDFVTRSIEVTDDLTIAVFEAKSLSEPKMGFRMSIGSTFSEVDGAIERIGGFVKEKVPDRFDWSMISIAIREALINAVEHGNRKKPELPVDIDVELIEDLLRVNISDCGSGFDVANEKKRLEKEGALRIHGRGIEMMENICQSISYSGAGISMKFTEIETDT